MAKAARKKATTTSGWELINKQRLLKWLFASALVIGAVGPVIWGVNKLYDPNVMPLRTIGIKGDFQYMNRAGLKGVVADAARGGFFSVDVKKVKEAADELAWVDRAEVRRIWPDKLHIHVTEQVPLAFWGKNGLVNVRGVVFRPHSSTFPATALPHLSGPDYMAHRVTKQYVLMNKLVAQHGLKIKRLQVNNREAWSFQLEDGLLVKLGSQDIEMRLSRFMKLYPGLANPAEGKLKQVDLRHTNGIAVRRLPPVDVSQTDPKNSLHYRGA